MRSVCELTRVEMTALVGFDLSDEQWTCVCAPMTPFSIVAGAGTGKTTVMAARVLWLVGSGHVQDHEVLGLTFTNKAAGELATRVQQLLKVWRERTGQESGEQGEPTIATYHAFAGRLLREQGLRVGVEPNARQLSQARVLALALDVLRDAPGLQAGHPGPSTLAGRIVALDAELAEQCLSTQELRDCDEATIASIAAMPGTTAGSREVEATARRRIEMAELVDQLRAIKARSGLDFSDQMRMGVALARSSASLCSSVAATFPVVLLDEYQDTSIAQRVLLSTLFAGRAVTAVGDPMQAIYGWRSASVANIDQFSSHFVPRGEVRAPIRVLSVNRRSGEAILEAANTVGAPLRELHPQVAPLRAPRPRHAQVCAALFSTVVQERDWIAGQVASLVEDGMAPDQIGILARVGAHLGPLRDALEARGVPAAIAGKEEILSLPGASEVVNTIRVLADPCANGALAALLAGPRWRIGPRDLALLGRRASVLAELPPAAPAAGESPESQLSIELERSVDPGDPAEVGSLMEALVDPGSNLGFSTQARQRFSAFAQEIVALRKGTSRTLVELANLIIETIGVRAEISLLHRQPTVDPMDSLLAMISAFCEEASGAGTAPSAAAFVAYLDSASALGRPGTVDTAVRPGCVQLMTIHKAKGLEWPVVVLPHMCAGVFPSTRPSSRWTTRAEVVPVSLRDDRHVLPDIAAFTTKDLQAYKSLCQAHDRTGEDRLGYVAITRAKDVLIASGHWWGQTQAKPRGPSDYLLSLRDHDGDPDSRPWEEAPADDEANPALAQQSVLAWPTAPGLASDGVKETADQVRRLLAQLDGGSMTAAQALILPEGLTATDRELFASIDADCDVLISAACAPDDPRPVVRLPDSLSASQVMALAADEQGFAQSLVRPMPAGPNSSASRGTQFHDWMQARLGVQPLFDSQDLPGAADGIDTDQDLEALKSAFEASSYANRTPSAVEVPFAIRVGQRTLRGRIDAVFSLPSGSGPNRWEVVDWKTSAGDRADPLQLAIYRLAWARLQGVDVDCVDAAFVFIRSGRVVRPIDLPGEDALVEILSGQAPSDPA